MKKLTIRHTEITSFSRQLATLLNAGIPIVQALDLLARGHSKSAMQYLIHAIKKNVESGHSVAETLRRFTKQFNALYCNLIAIGEQSGNLDLAFEQVANHQEKITALKRKIQKALFYPATIMLIAIIVTVAMLLFIVPQFSALFANFGAALPTATLIVIQLSDFLKHFGWLIILLLLAIFMTTRWFIKHSAAFAYSIDKLLLRQPLIGKLLTKAIIARFARTLATTFAAGLPLTDALQTIASSSGNKVYIHAILHVRERLMVGHSLQRSLQETKLFPTMVIQMIRIGEESGTLDLMLNKIAVMFENDVDHIVDNLGNLLEPAIMIILGLVIGTLIIALYLPIFKLGSIV